MRGARLIWLRQHEECTTDVAHAARETCTIDRDSGTQAAREACIIDHGSGNTYHVHH